MNRTSRGGTYLERKFVRRSLLYVPGSSHKFIERALTLSADGIIFDLEDAVSWQEKDVARQNVIKSIKYAKQTGKEVLVRINAVSSYIGIQDILEIVPERPDTLIIPKADEKTIIASDIMVGAIEGKLGWEANTIGFIPLMETAYSIVNAHQILCAANRINGVHLGAEDLTKELGVVRTKLGDELQYARSALIFAGRALGIDVFDSPFADFADVDGLAFDTNKAKTLGMSGKACIHPNQLSTVNSIFTPTQEEIEYARRVVETFDVSVREGKGACSLAGKMIDRPIVEKAQKILEKAKLTGNM